MQTAAELHAGVPLPCKPLVPLRASNSSERASSLPLSRPLLPLSRVYVNPATGVGPDPSSVVGFMHVLLTPSGVAVPADRRPRVPGGVWDGGGGGFEETTAGGDEAVAGSGSEDVAEVGDGRSRSAASAAAFCERPDGDAAGADEAAGREQQVLLSPAEVRSMQPGALVAAGNSTVAPVAAAMDARAAGKAAHLLAQPPIDPCVRALVGMSQCSGQGSGDVCCGYVRGWAASDCWCRASGQLLLDSMPASLLTPRLLQLLERVCDEAAAVTAESSGATG